MKNGAGIILNKRAFYLTSSLLWSALLLLPGNSARADTTDLEIHCVSKPHGAPIAAAKTAGITSKTERWIYEVSVENKTFKELSGLELKYVAFYRTEKLGDPAAPETKRKSGSVTVGTLKGHEKKTVSTGEIELRSSQLIGGTYYANGARQAAHDALIGLWVRAFTSGQQVSEYANPSTLLHEKWE